MVCYVSPAYVNHLSEGVAEPFDAVSWNVSLPTGSIGIRAYADGSRSRPQAQ